MNSAATPMTMRKPTIQPTPEKPTQQRDLAAQRRLGRYRLIRQIADGGSSRVYKAEDENGNFVAIKVLTASVAEDQTRLVRFYQEAKCMMELHHPNLVRAIEVGEDRGNHFLVMEYVDGESLASLLMRDGKMREETALQIAISMGEALAYAHAQDVIHRDISPKNVLVSKNGEIKICDFEFSKQTVADLDLTQQGLGLGTPDFMCPEQFKKAKDVDARSDIYSIGATLYVMVTGQLPFPGATLRDKWIAKAMNHFLPPETLRKSLSKKTVQLIKDSMEASPDNRPASAQEFSTRARQSLGSLHEAENRRKREEVVESKWTIVFLTEVGTSTRIKAKTSEITEMIRRGMLASDTRIAPERSNRFTSIRNTEPFRSEFRRRWFSTILRPLRNAPGILRSAYQSLFSAG